MRSLKAFGPEPRLEDGTGTQRAAEWCMMISRSISGSDTREGIYRLAWLWHQGEGLAPVLKLHIPLFHCWDNLHKTSLQDPCWHCGAAGYQSITAPRLRTLTPNYLVIIVTKDKTLFSVLSSDEPSDLYLGCISCLTWDPWDEEAEDF